MDRLLIARETVVNNKRQIVNFLRKIVFVNISIKYANVLENNKDFGYFEKYCN
ncbi:protein of unknown function [Candidatus Nitrosocosmicus franklandus]|uniref:Uncharacterized protein n=1 Tax=Candidatus Nitrosocosmicus franklandianus TaxID=1798806 RepID=A0A484IC98_9ARCH|nr:protein of unknown function [Candidatus Nitrosocosmicus franklandus]